MTRELATVPEKPSTDTFHIDPQMDAALASVFRPMARLMLAHDIGVRPIIANLKDAFVQVAVDEFGSSGKPASISHAAEIVGLTRRETSDIARSLGGEDDLAALYRVTEGAVLSRWALDPEYLDDKGAPRPLDLRPGPGSFAELVERVMGDACPDEVLEALVKSGSVSIDDDGRVSETRRDIDVSRDLPRQIGGMLGTLADTIAKNSAGEKASDMTQRVAHAESIPIDKLPIVRALLRKRIIRFVEEVDELLTEAKTDGDARGAETADIHRLGVGAYYFEIDRDRTDGDAGS